MTNRGTLPLRRTLAMFVAASAVVAASVTISSPGVGAAPDLEGDYIVVLNEDADARGVSEEHRRNRGAKVFRVYEHALKGYAATMRASEVAALRSDPRVDYVEADQPVQANTLQTGATWGLDRIDQRTLPLSTTYESNNTGTGVKAYIIDSGIDRGHGEFAGRVTQGYDAINGSGANSDCNGHGTHVAGTVGGTTYGVAKGVSLVAVRVLDCAGSGSWTGVIAGIDWAVADHAAGTPAVANLSLGGGASTSVDSAVQRLITDGVTVAVAAGNGNQGGKAQDACNYSPARAANALTIGATGRTDAKTSFSNYGNCVDWFAPGSAITSAWIGAGSTEINTISGTSMASPHTAGVAALYLQANPTASPATVGGALATATTKGIVTSSKTVRNHLLFTNY